jgi:hypothetical protein
LQQLGRVQVEGFLESHGSTGRDASVTLEHVVNGVDVQPGQIRDGSVGETPPIDADVVQVVTRQRGVGVEFGPAGLEDLGLAGGDVINLLFGSHAVVCWFGLLVLCWHKYAALKGNVIFFVQQEWVHLRVRIAELAGVVGRGVEDLLNVFFVVVMRRNNVPSLPLQSTLFLFRFAAFLAGLAGPTGGPVRSPSVFDHLKVDDGLSYVFVTSTSGHLTQMLNGGRELDEGASFYRDGLTKLQNLSFG